MSLTSQDMKDMLEGIRSRPAKKLDSLPMPPVETRIVLDWLENGEDINRLRIYYKKSTTEIMKILDKAGVL